MDAARAGMCTVCDLTETRHTSPATDGQSLTRRHFIGAGAAGAAVLGATACSSSPADSAQRDGASGSGPTNVLLVIIDSVRSDFVRSWGAERVRTPNIDDLAARGIRFTRFFPEAMPTVPSRRTIMTGRRIFPFRGWRRYPDLGRGPGSAPVEDLDSLFTATLSRAGYWTASVSDNPFLAFTRSWRAFRTTFDRYVSIVGHSGSRGDPGSVSARQLERWMPDGLRDDERYREGMRRYLANTGYGQDDSESGAARVFKQATKALEEAAQRQPFALVVDCFDPHEPWSPTAEFVDLYSDPDYRGASPGTARYRRADAYLETSEVRRMRAVYAAALTIADKWLGTFLERFRELGLEENTAIVLTSDHGLLLGDRGWTGKIAQEMHPELIQVPCVVIHPRRPGIGRSSAYFASTHDIAPTLLSLAGIDPPAGMDGLDLSPLFDGEQLPSRPFAYGGYFNHFYMRTDRWAFSADNRGQERELYDLLLDHPELDNVAAEYPEVHEDLYAALLDTVGGPLPYYQGDIVAPGRW